jgi:hypothetical protein
MSDPGQTSYDEIPYGSNPFSYTHPGCLAGVTGPGRVWSTGTGESSP